MAIELDNYVGKRMMRLEYKRPRETLGEGQSKHFRAELECVREDWCKVLILVVDEGQTSSEDMVRWGVHASHIIRARPWRSPKLNQHTTVRELGDWIVRWLWPPP